MGFVVDPATSKVVGMVVLAAVGVVVAMIVVVAVGAVLVGKAILNIVEIGDAQTQVGTQLVVTGNLAARLRVTVGFKAGGQIKEPMNTSTGQAK